MKKPASDPDKPLPLLEFISIYSRVPRLNVEIVIQTDEGILLTQRAIEPAKGQWHLPGGTILHSERVEHAVRRIAARELGVEVEVGSLLGFIEYPELAADGYFGWPIGLAFAAQIVAGDPVPNHENSAIKFWRTLPKHTLSDQQAFLRQKLAGK